MLPMRDNEQRQTVKIELLSQWMIEAEFRNKSHSQYDVFKSETIFLTRVF